MEVIPAESTLLVDGAAVRIEPKAMSVLLVLAEAGVNVVGREELIKKVWPRGFVTDDALNRCISNLRTALKDDPRSSRLIITVPRKGYRLAAPKKPVDDSPPDKGILVLPFQNLSAAASDYVADGLTELLIARISVAVDQPVISRTTAMTFRNSNKDLSSIGRQLGVRWVIEGSFMQIGDQAQIVVQLIDSVTDSHTWADTWTRPVSDLFTVLNEISRLVVEQVRQRLQPRLPAVQVNEALPTDLLRDYLLGINLNSRRTHESLGRAIECFSHVLRVRPDHAPSLSGQAFSYVLLTHYGAMPADEGFPRARNLAQKALKIVPDLADAMVHLAAVEFFYDWAFQQAEQTVGQALRINPNHEIAALLLADICLVRGKNELAQSYINRAIGLDPLNIGLLMNSGDLLILQNRYGEAIGALQAALAIEPSFRPARLRLAMAYAFNHQVEESMDSLQIAEDSGGRDLLYYEYLAIVRGALGNAAAAEDAATRLQELSLKSTGILPWSLARAWASAGKPDRAIDFLHEAFENRSSSMPFLGVTPVFKSIRHHREVRNLMRKMELQIQSE